MNCKFFIHLYCFVKCARLTNIFSISIVGFLRLSVSGPTTGQPVGCRQHRSSWHARVQCHHLDSLLPPFVRRDDSDPWGCGYDPWVVDQRTSCHRSCGVIHVVWESSCIRWSGAADEVAGCEGARRRSSCDVTVWGVLRVSSGCWRGCSDSVRQGLGVAHVCHCAVSRRYGWRCVLDVHPGPSGLGWGGVL
jgi:hypothetical protein